MEPSCRIQSPSFTAAGSGRTKPAKYGSPCTRSIEITTSVPNWRAGAGSRPARTAPSLTATVGDRDARVWIVARGNLRRTVGCADREPRGSELVTTRQDQRNRGGASANGHKGGGGPHHKSPRARGRDEIELVSAFLLLSHSPMTPGAPTTPAATIIEMPSGPQIAAPATIVAATMPAITTIVAMNERVRGIGATNQFGPTPRRDDMNDHTQVATMAPKPMKTKIGCRRRKPASTRPSITAKAQRRMTSARFTAAAIAARLLAAILIPRSALEIPAGTARSHVVPPTLSTQAHLTAGSAARPSSRTCAQVH